MFSPFPPGYQRCFKYCILGSNIPDFSNIWKQHSPFEILGVLIIISARSIVINFCLPTLKYAIQEEESEKARLITRHDNLVNSDFVHLFAHTKLHKDTGMLRRKTNYGRKHQAYSKPAHRTACKNLTVATHLPLQ